MSRGLTLFDTPFLGGAAATDWASRVVANGGALPSSNSINAMETFRLAMISAGLDTKMHSLCIFVPDSVIAATTPLFVGIGSDPWTNHNFVTGDLTVAGLKGNSTDKYLDTGVQAVSGQAVAAGTGNCGLTVIVTETNANSLAVEIGRQDSTVSSFKPLLISVSGGFTGAYSVFATKGVSGADQLRFQDGIRSGFVSGNSVAGTCNIYGGSPQVALYSLGTQAIATDVTSSTLPIVCFANSVGTVTPTISSFSGRRLSVAAIHQGLTSGEATTFKGLLETLRTALGGGAGDPGYAWGKRVELNGGAAPAANSITALNTFVSALDAASLIPKMLSVVPVAPDSLTACRVAVIGTFGSPIWSNVNFVGGDLTVNGLLGDESSKYLGSGFIPSDVGLFTSATGGMSFMVSDATNQPAVAAVEMGCSSAGSTDFVDQRGATTTEFADCWGFGGNDRISGALPSATWAGFISHSRTATNAQALYIAATGTGFTTLASTAGAQTITGRPTTEVYAFALNASGTPSFHSGHRLSFLSLHTGLTSGQSQSLYNAVAALRTSLGGGNP